MCTGGVQGPGGVQRPGGLQGLCSDGSVPVCRHNAARKRCPSSLCCLFLIQNSCQRHPSSLWNTNLSLLVVLEAKELDWEQGFG